MEQLKIPFDYPELPSKELTAADKIYLSEIKQQNFQHVHFLSCSSDTLRQTLYGEKRKQRQQEEERKQQEANIQKSKIQAHYQRKKWLDTHTSKTPYHIPQDEIFSHLYKAHYFDTHFTKNDAYHYEMNKQQIDSIAHQLLFTKQGTLFGRSAINLETIRKKMPLLLEKVKDTLTQGKSENKDLAPEDLPFIVLLLPRAEEIKYPLLEKMLEIIASLPITTIAHRQKIATHNESIRQKLLQQFGQEDKEKLLKYGLYPFWKYNDYYFYQVGGKHFNDPLPNGEIEYLIGCLKKQWELLKVFTFCFLLAYHKEFLKEDDIGFDRLISFPSRRRFMYMYGYSYCDPCLEFYTHDHLFPNKNSCEFNLCTFQNFMI